jgi:hypothetical protein
LVLGVFRFAGVLVLAADGLDAFDFDVEVFLRVVVFFLGVVVFFFAVVADDDVFAGARRAVRFGGAACAIVLNANAATSATSSTLIDFRIIHILPRKIR